MIDKLDASFVKAISTAVTVSQLASTTHTHAHAGALRSAYSAHPYCSTSIHIPQHLADEQYIHLHYRLAQPHLTLANALLGSTAQPDHPRTRSASHMNFCSDSTASPTTACKETNNKQMPPQLAPQD
jgi:hypothetical protein